MKKVNPRTPAFKFTKDGQHAGDLQQETICEDLKYGDYNKNRVGLRLWLFTLLRNIFINIYRRKKKAGKIMNSYTKEWELEKQLNKSYQLDTCTKDIFSHINALPVFFKQPFILYLEGNKYSEIADLLGEPLDIVKSRIYFARRILKSLIERS
ncbi:sigma-70 family RNA polymerase sigma factor [Danxiaibacter flavus]|uniref:Sigma-70 family RNA polymerase sigma factor n=1 Tax=Danxiaibacter flavus TaxID=3049108 RepID=A0ABV3ZJA8_9BACT|nr:sigma-70 family RNA polymerase sigma factor [Chitinophagaceae bacterium DXS]